jgi:hypothetical protein
MLMLYITGTYIQLDVAKGSSPRSWSMTCLTRLVFKGCGDLVPFRSRRSGKGDILALWPAENVSPLLLMGEGKTDAWSATRATLGRK